jgi:orotidine-5'-phosphate decarboxylase
MNPRPKSQEEARGRLIVALDVASAYEAEKLVGSLDGAARFYKVGLELWAQPGGRDVARILVESGHDVFLDLKLHDIPETVARATAAVSELGARFLTLHGPPTAVQAASARRGGTMLLGVTVLTSMDEEEWRLAYGLEAGRTLSDVVRARARMLLDAGCGGLICSPLEAAALRRAHPDATLVSPGVRPSGSATGDQKRVATPRAAIEAGADYLVVGRPIRDAADRRATVEAIVAEMWEGFAAPVAS